jgi:hypothetical protein
MTTSKLSQHPEDHSTFVPLDFPAKISQLQDHKKESQEELGQDYFTSAFGYLGKFDLNSPSLKTLEIYSPLKKGGYSKKSSFKLPKQGMMLNGQLFQQEMWEAVTFENVCGSLPTPTASDMEGGIAKDVQYKNGHFFRENKKGERWGVKLRDAITLLPTPTAMDHLPPRGLDSMIKQTQVHRKGRKKLANLREAVNPKAVKLFNELQQLRLPTPTSRDWKDSGENMNYKKAAEKKRLAGVLNHTHLDLTGEDTTLNPAFVEEMMGFPLGWTQIGETEKKE